MLENLTDKELLTALSSEETMAVCDECGLLTDSNMHWSCTEEWHDDNNGGLCTRNSEWITADNLEVRGRLLTIAEGLDEGEYNPLFVETVPAEIPVEVG